MNARRLVTAAAIASLAAGSGIALASTASAAPTDTVVVNCAGKGVMKPKEIVLSCADAGVALTKLTWSKWDANGATGTGTLTWNTCLPKTCVAGIVQKYKVKVELGGLASGPNLNVFSQANLTFPKGGPAALETGSYTLDNPVKQ